MNKFHFYHVPKTGGRSLTRAIFEAYLAATHGTEFAERKYNRANGRSPRAIKACGFKFQSFSKVIAKRVDFSFSHFPMWQTSFLGTRPTTFTVLRDPYQRALSRIRHLTDLQTSGEHPYAQMPELNAFVRLNDVDKWIEIAPDKWLQLHLFLFSKTRNPAEAAENIHKLDHVLRLETFAEDIAKLSAVMGRDIPVMTIKPSIAQVTLRPETELLLRCRLEPEYELMELVKDAGMGQLE